MSSSLPISSKSGRGVMLDAVSFFLQINALISSLTGSGQLGHEVTSRYPPARCSFTRYTLPVTTLLQKLHVNRNLLSSCLFEYFQAGSVLFDIYNL
ncbi:hypothetical protein RHMOL_Rhmol11G0076800 [Rhododendron molle]|uniref:Uncharacterized protein n=1 Tax=Rhododendron molle TaxID=49168 RepID=A0ACC0LQM2_RHOML|nr:hypothetical protein RHMOL_Rhmol11G0076800 [Rhododendron molle]